MLKDEIILKDRMREDKLSLIDKFDSNSLFIDVQAKVSILGNKNLTTRDKKSTRTRATKLRYPKNGLYGLL